MASGPSRITLLAVVAATAMLLQIASPAADAANDDWYFKSELTPTDEPLTGARYGASAAVSESRFAVIGTDFTFSSGSVIVYDLDTGTEIHQSSSPSPAFGDKFGISVAINNANVLVGAPGSNELALQSGAVYMFDRRSFDLVHTFVPDAVSDPAGARFGRAIDIDDEAILITTQGENITGSAYVFDLETRERLLYIDPGLVLANIYGFDAVLHPGRLFVSAPGQDRQSGFVAAYDRRTGEVIDPLIANEAFGAREISTGRSIAASDSILVVAAEGFENNVGRIGLYDALTAEFIEFIDSPDPTEPWRFGSDVAVEGDLLAVGAAGAGAGLVYLFDLPTRTLLTTLETADAPLGSSFGDTVAISRRQIVVGATTDDRRGEDGGAAWHFSADARLIVTPDPLPARGIADITMTNLDPNAQTWLLYSTAGVGPGNFLPSLNVFIDLQRPAIALGPLVSDATGQLEVEADVPRVSQELPIWLQAVQQNIVTNSVATSITP